MVVVVVVVVEGRRGHLLRSDNDRDSSFCQKFMGGEKKSVENSEFVCLLVTLVLLSGTQNVKKKKGILES